MQKISKKSCKRTGTTVKPSIPNRLVEFGVFKRIDLQICLATPSSPVRELVHFVPEGGARNPVDHGSSSRSEFSALDVLQGRLQLVFRVGAFCKIRAYANSRFLNSKFTEGEIRKVEIQKLNSYNIHSGIE